MALIAIAADKGAPGVTTASVALAAVWSRPVALAECDPSGGDLVYRLPAADGGRLTSQRGLLSLAVATRRGLQPQQIWEHAQKLYGGLDVLVGVSGAEQGAGLDLLWGGVGRAFAALPQADVIADCGRVGVDGAIYDLLAHAASIVLLTRANVGEVIRLRDRIAAMTAALKKRGRTPGRINVVVIADYKAITSAVGEVDHALQQSGAAARVVGGLAYEPKSAEQLRGEWGGKLDKSMFIRTARSIAGDLVSGLPELGTAAPPGPGGAEPGSDRRTVAPAIPLGTGPQPLPGRELQGSPQVPGYQPRQPSYRPPGSAPAAQPSRTPAGRPYPGQYPTDPGTAPPSRGGPAPGTQQPPAGRPQPYPVSPPPWQPSSPAPKTEPQPPTGTRPPVTPSSSVSPGLLPGSSRGRHAGTPTEPSGAQGQPRSERDDDLQSEREPAPGLPPSRPGGR
jgi:hypothetical protein